MALHCIKQERNIYSLNYIQVKNLIKFDEKVGNMDINAFRPSMIIN